MYNFKTYLQDLSQSTGIKFRLTGEDGLALFISDESLAGFNLTSFNVFLGKSRGIVRIPKEYEQCISLLKYTIENKYRELFSMKEQILIDILEGKEITADKVEKSLPSITKGCYVLIISVEGSRYEALNVIRQLYNEQEILCTIFGDNVILIGVYDDIVDHATSIRDSIVSNLYCKCLVSFSDKIYSPENIKKGYDDAKECMLLGKKFGLKDEIFNYEKMMFEKIVHYIKPEVKQELLLKFKEKLNMFDSEMITTIEEFVNSGLNISDSAKKLYIHRNTLIYRLDKIYKDTGFDIRNFREATVFIIAFLVWKENK